MEPEDQTFDDEDDKSFITSNKTATQQLRDAFDVDSHYDLSSNAPSTVFSNKCRDLEVELRAA